MIKVENIETFGWEAALRGMRNPKNSWNKSDSYTTESNGFYLGENDMKLASTLVKAGTEHRKFTRMIHIQMDITAPMFWWKEMDQYRVSTTTNGCSTMHKLLDKPFEVEDFSFDSLPGYKKEIKQFRPEVDEQEEIWIEIQNSYKISNCGRIKNKYERILGGSLHKDGYIFVTLNGKQIPLHRLVATAFIPNPENKPEINHKDGNKQNNFVNNLEWCTRSENQTHAVENNLQPKPVNTYKGKFSLEQREEIKRLWNEGVPERQIAKQFNVSHSTICSIINDKYKYADQVNIYQEVAIPLVDTLNELRDAYFMCETEEGKKKIWYSIIELLPSSYNQKRTWDGSFETMLNIMHQRDGHKLKEEWEPFRKACFDNIPYLEEFYNIAYKKGE